MGAGTEGFSTAPREGAGLRLAVSGQLIVLLPFLAVMVLATALIELLPVGHLTRRMVLHIFLMNLLAPVAAGLVVHRSAGHASQTTTLLVLVTALQIVVLWGWHAPQLLPAVMHAPMLHHLMVLSLFAVAYLFWHALFRQGHQRSWLSILSLMITGKLFCLLGFLLVFSPRNIYALAQDGGAGLHDQQLAGLLMIVVCSLVYVTCSVWIAARWFHNLGRRESAELLARAGS